MRPRPRVALLIETSNSYGRGLLTGIRAYLREHPSWSIRLSEHGRGEGGLGWLRKWDGDGIIARLENVRIVQAVAGTGLPVVDVSAGAARPLFPRVVTDSRAVTKLAAEHLLERAFKHFGYCGNNLYHWSNQRQDYFVNHIRAAGWHCDVYPDKKPRGRTPSWESEVDAITRWLVAMPKPVGVMACYDIRGQQVLEACRDGGLSVPDEVAVIGAHNDELLCDLADPPLSSVIPDAGRAGYQAAGLLAAMMRGEKVPVRVHYVEPLGVATRHSTDVLAVSDPKVSAAVRFIREHAVEGIDVANVLRAVPISRSLLERRFKQLLGRTPHEQILRVKIERVKSMLALTELPLTVIAERAGFEHAEYLSVAFKRVTGQSPRAYRLKHRLND